MTGLGSLLTPCRQVLILDSCPGGMENTKPPTKKRKLSLSLRQPLKDRNSSRFASPTKRCDLEKAAEGVVLAITRNSTNFAVRTFLSWVEERNKSELEQTIEADILSSNDAERVSFVMHLLVMEVWKADGESIPRLQFATC